MNLEVRCFATLAPKAPKGYHLHIDETNATPELIMDKLGIAPEEVKLIFLNGRHASLNDALHDNDRLTFVPAVGGG